MPINNHAARFASALIKLGVYDFKMQLIDDVPSYRDDMVIFTDISSTRWKRAIVYYDGVISYEINKGYTDFEGSAKTVSSIINTIKPHTVGH